MSKARCICGCCCCVIIFIIGFIFLGSWLALRHSIQSPKISLLNLQLPVNTINNGTLTFTLKLDNPNHNVGIQYTNLKTSFHYPSNESSSFADVVVPEFYQESSKKDVKKGTGEVRNFKWSDIVGNGSVAKVDVGVRVVGSLRFKRDSSWITNSSMSVGVVAGVDEEGEFSSENGWRLKSAAVTKTARVWSIGWCLILSLVVVVISSVGFNGFSL